MPQDSSNTTTAPPYTLVLSSAISFQDKVWTMFWVHEKRSVPRASTPRQGGQYRLCVIQTVCLLPGRLQLISRMRSLKVRAFCGAERSQMCTCLTAVGFLQYSTCCVITTVVLEVGK
jgi:hypothetical protein